ncbi:unnamed protein product [Urochloa decumbens]|uniref:Uncharacterized protein n=1 Tax=Urochloa decumbens TaxID=240449 RepID=A0ABC9CSN4_9POAL
MDPRRHRRRIRGGAAAADADFVGVGLALVLSAVSCLLFAVVAGSNEHDGGMEWEVVPAFGVMSAGLLLIMHGMRAPGARPPALVRGVANAAGAALLRAGGPERLVAVLILLLLPLLEAWFDFF